MTAREPYILWAAPQSWQMCIKHGNKENWTSLTETAPVGKKKKKNSIHTVNVNQRETSNRLHISTNNS